MSELAYEHDELLYRLLAGKVDNGYQIEIVTISGQSYFGFPSGLDRDMVQIFTTEYGELRGNVKHPYGKYSLIDKTTVNEQVVEKTLGYYIWIPITNIEAIVENRLKTSHFDPESQKKIKSSQNNFARSVRSWLTEKEGYRS